jgi:hypothetical protein
MPVIGWVNVASRQDYAGLGEAGYVDGRNVSIEYRWEHGEGFCVNPRVPATTVRGFCGGGPTATALLAGEVQGACQPMSAFGAKRTSVRCCERSAFDPKRTSVRTPKYA